MGYIIKSEKTAIVTGVSKSTEYILNNIDNSKVKILDYGAGKLRNAKCLKEKGYNISVLDTAIQVDSWKSEDKKLFNIYKAHEVDIIKDKFDIITCSYVLNVISDIKERESVLLNIKNLLNQNGLLLIDVRGTNSLSGTKSKEPFNDGYIVGKGSIRTFQKEYSKQEIISLLESFGFEIINIKKNNTNFNVVCKMSN